MKSPSTLHTSASSPQSLPEVDVELFSFVERYATNLVRWDLLLYFGGHPEAQMTAAELARRLRRTVRATTKELDDLTYLRILTRRYTPDQVTYALVGKGSARRTAIRLAAFARSQSAE